MLQTLRLTLRPVDLETALELWSGGADHRKDPGWAPGYPMPGTMDAALMLIVSAEAGVPPMPYGMYQMVENDTGLVVGDIGFHGPPDENGEAEVGYGVVFRRQNRGYATEALLALVDWAVADGQARALVAHTDAYNLPSARALQRCGFEIIDSLESGRMSFRLDLEARRSP